MIDNYVYIITALLPLVAGMLIFQVNPYHALVIRGILGAVTVLAYTVLGAADVALTEALVGTLLAVALYTVAVRSSMVLRLGVLTETIAASEANDLQPVFKQFTADLKAIFNKHHLRVELVPYSNREELHQALVDKEIHATCTHSVLPVDHQPYDITIRLHRLYEILRADLAPSTAHLTYAGSPSAASVSTSTYPPIHSSVHSSESEEAHP
jgi:putative multicomponent Na+:H+ antiporter subunit B